MIAFSILTFLYVLLLLALLISWEKIPNYPSGDSAKLTQITVVIAVRNEEDNIINLLNDLNVQNYPYNNFEVIVIDDFSTDNTATLVLDFITKSKFQLQLLKLPDSFINSSSKKRCIGYGIEKSKGNLIITTDGDCRVGNNWISSIENLYTSRECKIIAGPVTFFNSKNIFKEMQVIEFASLIGSGAASLNLGYPNMCNGANLAYEKKAYLEVNGFEGNENIASGDDEFLMHKIFEKYPDELIFLKDRDSIVTTKSKDSIQEFYNQRVRWAGKWGYYRLNSIKVLAFFIFLYNLSLIGSAVLMFMDLFPASLFLEQIIIKVLVEFVFLRRVLGFLGKKIKLLPYLALLIIYPFYVVLFAFASFSGRYEWKGRKIKTIKL